jgi:hypothetical protein
LGHFEKVLLSLNWVQNLSVLLFLFKIAFIFEGNVYGNTIEVDKVDSFFAKTSKDVMVSLNCDSSVSASCKLCSVTFSKLAAFYVLAKFSAKAIYIAHAVLG